MMKWEKIHKVLSMAFVTYVPPHSSLSYYFHSQDVIGSSCLALITLLNFQ